MISPFPGMDPYIEACGLWGDFHHHLISEIKIALAQTAPERYLIRTGERSYVVLVQPEVKESDALYSDAGVSRSSARRRQPQSGKGVAGASEAEKAHAQLMTMRTVIEEEYREAFVEIYEAEPEQRLVTCIEVLSPPDKRSCTVGWEIYLRKRQGLLLGNVNLVEIDLLRGGQRLPMRDEWPDSPYTLLVARPDKKRRCLVWPAHFQHPLPAIPVPLVKPDPDLSLQLQPMIETIYHRSRYAQSIDYRKPLQPPLSRTEAPG